MFYTLSKLFTFLLMPFSWLVFAICISVFSRKITLKRKAAYFSIFLLFAFGNIHLVNMALNIYEPPNKTLAGIKPADIGIVLGGGIMDDYRRPFDRPHFDFASDRLLQALQLYKKGLIKKILITGGPDNPQHLTEEWISKKFLKNMNLPDSVILVESHSKNTFENARNTAAYLKSKGLFHKKLLLITSGFHMKRAKACFDKQGFVFETFPCNKLGYRKLKTDLNLIMPSEEAFYNWSLVIKEWFGLLVYKIMGYV